MDGLRYMFAVVQKGAISLTFDEERVLSLFTHNRFTSTYMIWKSPKHHKIAYKNVHKKVAKLHNLGLLRIVKRSEKHGAIYYELTSLGLFYSIQSHFYPEFSKLIDNYSNDEIFNIFLYPYIQKQTIRSLNSGIITGVILDYLIACLHAIYSEVSSVVWTTRQEMTTVFPWSMIPSKDSSLNKYFLQYLRERFGIEWLNDNESLEKSSDGKELRITSGNEKYLVIKLDESNSNAPGTATLMDNKDVIFEFAVLGDDICEYESDWFSDDERVRQYSTSISNTVQLHAQKLSFTLLSLDEYDSNQTIYPYDRWLMKERVEMLKQDINLIKKDKKFVALCKYFYKQFEKYKIF